MTNYNNSPIRKPNPGFQASKSTQVSDCEGVLELHPKGYGFLRQLSLNIRRTDDDVFVPQSTISSFELRQGNFICGTASRSRRSAKGLRLMNVQTIDGLSPESPRPIQFEDRRVTNPKSWLRLECESGPMSMRVLDLLVPIGMGQRALIASPPRAGKTTLLKQIATSVATNYPEVELIALLIDERPEEVADFEDDVQGQVFASCIDQTIESHNRLSQLVIDRCKCLVESGKDVVLLLDSLTRMSRAFNKVRSSGPVGAGGLNIRALDIPKQIFASARNLKGEGSLTIIASVLLETENRMDDVIFQEFKGTGNADIVLSSSLADQRTWPAIDLKKSATRRIELLHDEETFAASTFLRRSMSKLANDDAINELMDRMRLFPRNHGFVRMVNEKLASRSARAPGASECVVTKRHSE